MKLQYSWEELRPIHPLSYTVLACQILGAGTNLLLHGFDYWYDAAWQGGVFGTFIGFLVGLLVQTTLRPGTISENRSMVAFCGFISFTLFMAGLFFPLYRGAA